VELGFGRISFNREDGQESQVYLVLFGFDRAGFNRQPFNRQPYQIERVYINEIVSESFSHELILEPVIVEVNELINVNITVPEIPEKIDLEVTEIIRKRILTDPIWIVSWTAEDDNV
jgi:hypothetical protein